LWRRQKKTGENILTRLASRVIHRISRRHRRTKEREKDPVKRGKRHVAFLIGALGCSTNAAALRKTPAEREPVAASNPAIASDNVYAHQLQQRKKKRKEKRRKKSKHQTQ